VLSLLLQRAPSESLLHEAGLRLLVATLPAARTAAVKEVLAKNLATLLQDPAVATVVAAKGTMSHVVALLDTAHHAADVSAACTVLSALLHSPVAAKGLAQHGLLRSLVDSVKTQLATGLVADPVIESLLAQFLAAGPDVISAVASDGFGASLVLDLLTADGLKSATRQAALNAVVLMAQSTDNLVAGELLQGGVVAAVVACAASEPVLCTQLAGAVLLALSCNPNAGSSEALTAFQVVQRMAETTGALQLLVPLLGMERSSFFSSFF
jgi:hypothetical protein